MSKKWGEADVLRLLQEAPLCKLPPSCTEIRGIPVEAIQAAREHWHARAKDGALLWSVREPTTVFRDWNSRVRTSARARAVRKSYVDLSDKQIAMITRKETSEKEQEHGPPAARRRPPPPPTRVRVGAGGANAS